MQTEINGIHPAVPIRIFGVNEMGLESGNPTITAGRTIPWLQDQAATNVWASWAVTYRDVVILDPSNVKVAVYNLTINDLSNPTNYATLRDMLLSYAH